MNDLSLDQVAPEQIKTESNNAFTFGTYLPADMLPYFIQPMSNASSIPSPVGTIPEQQLDLSFSSLCSPQFSANAFTSMPGVVNDTDLLPETSCDVFTHSDPSWSSYGHTVEGVGSVGAPSNSNNHIGANGDTEDYIFSDAEFDNQHAAIYFNSSVSFRDGSSLGNDRILEGIPISAYSSNPLTFSPPDLQEYRIYANSEGNRAMNTPLVGSYGHLGNVQTNSQDIYHY